ncbi:lipase maturation factor 1 isoform X3 [Silurus meridionalis]|uniref:lipase maturation factor 1 isoform X3 n=1 Tax=Silurus meridionalis TaxID=175797 RepID=UPI001EEB0455|nr:lipase maturation factor 1 isoform X3 [Silurus meridionalis]
MRTQCDSMAECKNLECAESSLRRRHKGETLSSFKKSEDSKSETVQQKEKNDKKEEVRVRTGTYWLTRILLLRSIAFIYFVAFTVAYNQNKQLIGERGLTPSRDYLRSVKRYVGGWESQLLETGFLCIFLCPVWSLAKFPRHCPPSLISIWSFRWLIVRIMLGAGLIKIRGDHCWRDLTCMDYHYETQPVPNPISYFLHHSPWWFHRFETMSNHFIELVVPFFTFMGRRMCMVNGVLQILFQVVLILSGNLSFLNWVTIVPSLACFDDAALAFLFRPSHQTNQTLLKNEEAAEQTPTKGMLIRRVVNVAFGILIAYLSVPVVINLLSPRQVMNTSFDPLRIVNTYGAFGSITKERTEVVFQGTLNVTHSDEGVVWEEYEFMCKPGTIERRPCLISPYHYRLDWLMWFAAFQTYEQNEWVIQIAGRLLANDSTVLSLMAHNPFQGKDKPRWIRGEHFRYKFTKPGSASAAKGNWWVRKRIGPYFPPVNLEGLRKYFRSRNWPQPDIE